MTISNLYSMVWYINEFIGTGKVPNVTFSGCKEL